MVGKKGLLKQYFCQDVLSGQTHDKSVFKKSFSCDEDQKD
jgi:hypothetical protein